jgi:hypothetical protein
MAHLIIATILMRPVHNDALLKETVKPEMEVPAVGKERKTFADSI